MEPQQRPPAFARFLARLLIPRGARETVLGDLDEGFVVFALRRHGARRARAWYRRQVVASVLAFARDRAIRRGSPLSPRPRRSESFLRSIWSDARYALRAMARNPARAAVGIGTLALGIGATTAVFGMVNEALLRPVPGVPDPDGLAAIAIQEEDGAAGYGISMRNFLDVRAASRAFEGLAAVQSAGQLQAHVEGAGAIALNGSTVAGDYFELLGVVPAAGRLFTAAESMPGGALVAVISESLWERLYDRSQGAIGAAINVNRAALTIIGVAAGFQGHDLSEHTEVWVPVSLYPLLRHIDEERIFARRQTMFYDFVGRFAEGVETAVAERELNAILDRLRAEYPEETRTMDGRSFRVFPGIGLPHLAREVVRERLRLLAGVVSLVLIIACANLANLLLSRGLQRRGETALRRALGASRRRILRMHLVESSVLAVFGGIAGIALALLLDRLLVGLSPAGLSGDGLALDWRVLTFAFGAALLTGLLFGAVPASAAGRTQLTESLKEGARQVTGRTGWLRSAFVIVQLSLALPLLVGAVVLLRTMQNLNSVPLGFDASVLTVHVDPEPQGYTREQVDALQRRVLAGFDESPGVRAALVSRGGAFLGGFSMPIQSPGGAEDETLSADVSLVTPGYFDVLGIDIARGRPLLAADWAAERDAAVVLSAALARRLFGDADPLGRTIRTRALTPEVFTVVGIAADTRSSSPRSPVDLMIYRTISGPFGGRDFTVFVRTSLPRESAEPLIRAALAAGDPNIPMGVVLSLEDRVRMRIAQERLLARLLSAFALLAILLSAVGLYGVIAWAVTARTREIGVRIALGARRSAILHMVVRHSAILFMVGTVLGLAGAFALVRVLESRLFGIDTLDAASYLAAVLVFTATSALAITAPTRNALRVDPLEALRSE